MSGAERWLPVVGYEGLYEVSDQGRVRSVDRIGGRGRRYCGRIRKIRASSQSKGRRVVDLSKDGILRTHLAHRLVARAFIGAPPFDGALVRHLNDIPGDNRVENLSYGTVSDNSLDAVRNGVHPQAKKVNCARGHALAGRNLVPRSDGKSKRRCLACLRAGYSKYQTPAVEFDMQRLSDAHYAVIKSGPGGTLPTEVKMSCTITKEVT